MKLTAETIREPCDTWIMVPEHMLCPRSTCAEGDLVCCFVSHLTMTVHQRNLKMLDVGRELWPRGVGGETSQHVHGWLYGSAVFAAADTT